MDIWGSFRYRDDSCVRRQGVRTRLCADIRTDRMEVACHKAVEGRELLDHSDSLSLQRWLRDRLNMVLDDRGLDMCDFHISKYGHRHECKCVLPQRQAQVQQNQENEAIVASSE